MLTPIAVVAIIQSVALVALLLIAIGLGLSLLTWWFWTTARPEPVSLAPLEVMSERRYSKASEDERIEMIKSAHDLVIAAKSPRKTRQAARRTGRQSQPELGKSKPVDPLLK
jgi:hypothetical protein